MGGHYPVWAIGQDPPTGIRQDLRDALNKWEAQYFNGHEHDFEHIVEEGSKVNYISTGAGKMCWWNAVTEEAFWEATGAECDSAPLRRCLTCGETPAPARL